MLGPWSAANATYIYLLWYHCRSYQYWSSFGLRSISTTLSSPNSYHISISSHQTSSEQLQSTYSPLEKLQPNFLDDGFELFLQTAQHSSDLFSFAFYLRDYCKGHWVSTRAVAFPTSLNWHWPSSKFEPFSKRNSALYDLWKSIPATKKAQGISALEFTIDHSKSDAWGISYLYGCTGIVITDHDFIVGR